MIIASPDLRDASPRQFISLYTRRSFRDLKSHRYGAAFEDSVTRIGQRLAVLLMIHMQTCFACWLLGISCEQDGHAAWLAPSKARHNLYSTLGIGREALLKR